MVIHGDHSHDVTYLLKSMLHAWYDLTKEEACTWTTQFDAKAAFQRALKPEQLTRLICEELFHGWRRFAIDARRRERRNSSSGSESAWVQRLMEPKENTTRRRQGGVEGSRAGKASKREEGGGVASNSEQEVAVGGFVRPSSSLKGPSRRDGQRCHPFRSRYLRVNTTSPESIRHGRSPAAPVPPSAVAPAVAVHPSAAAAAAHRCSRRSRLRHRSRRTEPVPVGSNETRRGDEYIVVPERSFVAADGSFVPGGPFVSSGSLPPKGCFAGIHIGNARLTPWPPCDGGRRHEDQLVCESKTCGRQQKFRQDAAAGSSCRSHESQKEGETDLHRRGSFIHQGGGLCDGASSNSRCCSPPLTWEELEPWAQRNPRAQRMLSSRGGRGDVGERNGGINVVDVPMGTSIGPNYEILRQVAARLDHLDVTDHRQQKTAALLLLLRGEEESSRRRAHDADGNSNNFSSRSRHGETTPPPATAAKRGRSAACFTPGRSVAFPADGRTHAQSGWNRSGSRRIAGKGRIVRGGKSWSRGSKGESSGVRGSVSNGDEHGTVPSRFVMDVVGRDIACVRKARGKISEPDFRSESSSPASLGPDEARGVMFGLGTRLGRCSEREDRWI